MADIRVIGFLRPLAVLTAVVLVFLCRGMASGTDIRYLLGKFSPEREPGFVEISPHHAVRGGMFLREECYRAFTRMFEAARHDGIELLIVSATRSFAYQKWIWERKWSGKVRVGGFDLSRKFSDPVERSREILRYSAMPGTSRHHWGTDIDINSVEPRYFQTPEGRRVYQWLAVHAGRYGFCQVYSSRGTGRQGYEEEPWHWSYLPLSRQLLRDFLENVGYKHIRGFPGDHTARELQVIERYVQGINTRCR